MHVRVTARKTEIIIFLFACKFITRIMIITFSIRTALFKVYLNNRDAYKVTGNECYPKNSTAADHEFKTSTH